MTSTTPDALWGSPALRTVRPAAAVWSDLRRGDLLRDCSLSVPVGARLLIVSDPPASGSLLLRILAGLSPARGGRVELAGSSDPSPVGWGRRVAYLGPEPGIRSWMTPREALNLAASLLLLGPAAAARRFEEVVAWARIPAAELDRPVRRSGAAIAQRAGLACALIGDPEVLLLDEPLRAIDAAERTRLLRLPGERRTVLQASRYPASEAGLGSHVCLLRAGRVSLVAPVADLEVAGLPLSMQGIITLAEGRVAPSHGRGSATPAVATR